MLIDVDKVMLTNVHDWELQRMMKEEFPKPTDSV